MTLGPVVVMGVSGAGKTTIARMLAAELGARFLDADDLHSDAARAKMAAGTPLDDADREPWLERVAAAATGDVVVACSALKRRYRDILRAGAPGVRFVELDVSRAELERRLAARTDHFMPASLLDSQLATLEPLEADEAGVRVSADAAPDAVVAAARAAIAPDRHGTAVVELDLAHPVDAVFACFSDPMLRARWFRMPGSAAARTNTLDFREGGTETTHGEIDIFGTVESLDYRAQFFAIDPGRRLVYANELHVQGIRQSVSLVDITFEATAGGTRLVCTEQFTMLGPDEGVAAAIRERRGGLRLQLNGLVAVLG